MNFPEIFLRPGFSWNKGAPISLPKHYLLGAQKTRVNSVAIIWPDDKMTQLLSEIDLVHQHETNWMEKETHIGDMPFSTSMIMGGKGGTSCSYWKPSKAPKFDIILVGGWTNPFEKYARQIGSLPQGEGENKKCLSCHHLDWMEETYMETMSVRSGTFWFCPTVYPLYGATDNIRKVYKTGLKTWWNTKRYIKLIGSMRPGWVPCN